MSEASTESAGEADVPASLVEERQLTDNAEQAVEALLLALLLQSGASFGAATATAAGPTALRSLLDPVLHPMLLAIGLIMLRRSNRRGSASEWQPLVDRTMDDVVQRVHEAISTERREASDIYGRTADGPDAAPEWARRIAHTLVTSVSEGFKRGLANRLGFDYKRWVSREDTRVRQTHKHLHGQTVHRNDTFRSQSGALLDRPGDTSAPIGEWINCRCDVLWLKGRHA